MLAFLLFTVFSTSTKIIRGCKKQTIPGTDNYHYSLLLMLYQLYVNVSNIYVTS